MSVLQSIFLGIVQGITEFLPVSSSGHLAILENIFHIDTDGGMLFTGCRICRLSQRYLANDRGNVQDDRRSVCKSSYLYAEPHS